MCMDKLLVPDFNALDLFVDTKMVHGANSDRSLICGVDKTLLFLRLVYPWHRARERTMIRLQRAIDVIDLAVTGRSVVLMISPSFLLDSPKKKSTSTPNLAADLIWSGGGRLTTSSKGTPQIHQPVFHQTACLLALLILLRLVRAVSGCFAVFCCFPSRCNFCKSTQNL